MWLDFVCWAPFPYVRVFETMACAHPRKMMTCHPFLNSPSPEQCGAQIMPGGILQLCWVLGASQWIWPSSSLGLALALALTGKQFGAFSRWQQVLEAGKQSLAASMDLLAGVFQEPPAASVLKDDLQYTLWMLRCCNSDCSGCSCSLSTLNPLLRIPLSKFSGLGFRDVQRNTFEFLTVFLD